MIDPAVVVGPIPGSSPLIWSYSLFYNAAGDVWLERTEMCTLQNGQLDYGYRTEFVVVGSLFDEEGSFRTDFPWPPADIWPSARGWKQDPAALDRLAEQGAVLVLENII